MSEIWLWYFGLNYIAFFRGVAPYDIAVLELEIPLVFNERISAVKLPEQDEVRVGNAVLSGWGSVSKKLLPVLPKVLQKVTIPLLDNESCQAKFPKDLDAPKVYDSQICTDVVGEISACSVSNKFKFFLLAINQYCNNYNCTNIINRILFLNLLITLLILILSIRSIILLIYSTKQHWFLILNRLKILYSHIVIYDIYMLCI